MPPRNLWWCTVHRLLIELIPMISLLTFQFCYNTFFIQNQRMVVDTRKSFFPLVIHCENGCKCVKHFSAHFAEYFSYWCILWVTQLSPGGADVPTRAGRLTAHCRDRLHVSVLAVQMCACALCRWTVRKGAFGTVTAQTQHSQVNHRGSKTLYGKGTNRRVLVTLAKWVNSQQGSIGRWMHGW